MQTNEEHAVPIDTQARFTIGELIDRYGAKQVLRAAAGYVAINAMPPGRFVPEVDDWKSEMHRLITVAPEPTK